MTGEIFLGMDLWHRHNQAMRIEPGTLVVATTASGVEVPMRALSQPTQGRDFPIVWVCTEGDYQAGLEGDETVMIPWPLDALAVPEPA
jgi:hypothetical protein